MFVEQRKHVVDDRVLGLREEVRFREGGLRNVGTGILVRRNSVMMS
jgi:hypothetical protein